MKPFVLALAFVFSTFAIVNCGGGGDDYGGSGSANGSPTATAQHEVEMIGGNLFSPDRIEIRPGDTVRWVNVDTMAHTATGADFNSGSIPPGGSFQHTFSAAGEFGYRCTLHPGMNGTIVVME